MNARATRLQTSTPARVTPSCPRSAAERVAQFQPDNLSDAYAKISAVRKDKTHPEAIPAARETQLLLNKLFYPLVDLLSESVNALSDDELKTRARTAAEKIPTEKQPAWNGAAYIPRTPRLDYGRCVRELALQGNSEMYKLSELDARAKEFVYRWPSRGWLEDFSYYNGVIGFYITPVGAYGSQLAEDMVLTCAVLVDIARAELKEASRKSYRENRPLLVQETARARFAETNGMEKGLTPLATVVEGVLSLNQVLSTLLLENVPGTSSGKDALQALIFDGTSKLGLVTDYTSRVPMGVTGPLAMQGRGFSQPVEVDERGGVSLPPEMQKKLREYFELNHKPTTGVCPMTMTYKGDRELGSTRKLSGLQLLAEAYWRVFEQVHARRV